ncbi:DUF433 domain-containing protein [Candidatus Daviesbacteria bacterium]|nr:DUF433 domain-containing protein [Candidatus Daviesbacteria bacterium]
MKKIARMSNKDLVPGSKVPIAFLIDYIKEGYSIKDFLSNYPWVKKKSVQKALAEVKKRDFTSQYAI